MVLVEYCDQLFAPLLVLMSRDSKRNTSVLKVVCIILIVGHWLDYFHDDHAGYRWAASKLVLIRY